jgi:hypothetical protein
MYDASYFQLEQERLHIEVWDSEQYQLNKFLAYNSIPLIDIIDGPMQQTIQVYAYDENFAPVKRPTCTISFKVNFAEIWDYHLEFLDWH